MKGFISVFEHEHVYCVESIICGKLIAAFSLFISFCSFLWMKHKKVSMMQPTWKKTQNTTSDF